jgi:signal transduction histidine kinase
MIEELLDVSRIVKGQIELQENNVELADIVEHTVQSFRPDVDDKRITVKVHLPPAPCRIFGDAHRLQQIVWNLLSNAIKFTPPEGEIILDVTCSATEARLLVRDNGDGIDPAVLPHVFDRFRQGDSSPGRRHRGLGLGLAIVRHLVEAHGGSVTAASDGPGHGASFSVTLPLAGPERRAHRRRTPRADARPADGSGLRVLLVDDDTDGLEVL